MAHVTRDQLAAAARTYRAAIDDETDAKAKLAAARKKRAEAGEQVAKARGPLADAIVEAVRAGTRQRDILERIGNVYTRETIRRICKAAGVEPPSGE